MYKQLTSEQRYTISVLPQKKMSLSFIAETIGVSVGTVSREIRRNSNSKGVVSLIKASGLRTRTITTDDGTEFAAHEAIARELKTIVYFAHPYSPWEKGAMENANGLVRQYIPKQTDFRGVSHRMVRQIMDKINNRPRKKNGFYKPLEMIGKTFP